MFDPYYPWFHIPKGMRPVTHYQLLGVSAEERNTQIIEEAAIVRSTRIRAFQLRYPEESTRVLNDIARAMITLLDPQRRDEYDAGLESATTGKMADACR